MYEYYNYYILLFKNRIRKYHCYNFYITGNTYFNLYEFVDNVDDRNNFIWKGSLQFLIFCKTKKKIRFELYLNHVLCYRIMMPRFESILYSINFALFSYWDFLSFYLDYLHMEEKIYGDYKKEVLLYYPNLPTRYLPMPKEAIEYYNFFNPMTQEEIDEYESELANSNLYYTFYDITD